MKRSSPLRRHAPLRRGTPLGQTKPRPRRCVKHETPITQAERREALLGERRDVRREKLARDPFCELRVTRSCRVRAHEATDVHEIVRRGQGGSIVDPRNLLSLCAACHRIVTDHPAFAECIGADLPEWTRDQWPAAELLSRSCQRAWLREGWEMEMIPFWSRVGEETVRRSVEAARRDAERL